MLLNLYSLLRSQEEETAVLMKKDKIRRKTLIRKRTASKAVRHQPLQTTNKPLKYLLHPKKTLCPQPHLEHVDTTTPKDDTPKLATQVVPSKPMGTCAEKEVQGNSRLLASVRGGIVLRKVEKKKVTTPVVDSSRVNLLKDIRGGKGLLKKTVYEEKSLHTSNTVAELLARRIALVGCGSGSSDSESDGSWD